MGVALTSFRRDLGLLLRLRTREARNAVRFALPVHKAIGAGLALGSVALFVVITVAFAALLRATDAQSPVLMRVLVERAALFLFLFLLAGGIPFVSGVLLAPGDLPLLAASPVRPAALVCARLVDSVSVSSAQFVVIGVPLLLASALAVGLSPVGWLVWTLTILLFLTLPALAVAALVLILARIVGLRRIRAAVAIASAILATILCLATVREFSAQSQGNGLASVRTLDPDALAARVREIRAEAPPTVLPSTWATQLLFALPSPRPSDALLPFALMAGTTLALGGVCLLTGGPVLIGESLLEGDTAGGYGKSKRPAWLEKLISLIPLPLPAQALLAKDFRYVARDLTLLSQLGIPLILIFVPFVIAGQLGSSRDSAGDLLLLSLGIVGTVVYMETSILGLSALGLEGRGFWIVRSAPVSSARLVGAKWFFAFGTSLAVSAPLFLASCLYFSAENRVLLLLGLVVLIIACAALCGLASGLAGLFPRFIYENPAHRASLSALVWGFVGATLYLIFAGVALGGGWYASLQWPEQARLFWSGGAAFFVLLSLATGLLPLLTARARLENYAWEH